MEECNHKWKFQETIKKVQGRGNRIGGITAYFYRTDIYYCENCCKINRKHCEGSVDLPTGGRNNIENYEPEWY